MLLVNIVLNVMLQSIGTHSPKDVLLANQDIPGTVLPMNAHAVKPQDQLLMDNAPAQHQKPHGTQTQNNASAHQTHSEITARHAQLQEFGTGTQINVYAHHQQTTGIKPPTNANAQSADMDQTVFNAQPQDIGISIPTNAFVKVH